MPQDNERIIEISAGLSTAIRQAAIAMLNAGAPGEMVAELLQSTVRLDRAPEMLTSGGSGCLGGISGLVSAELVQGTDPAIAQISKDLGRVLDALKVDRGMQE